MGDEKNDIESVAADVKEKFSGDAALEVRRINVELYVDSTGDDAVRFQILLADRPNADSTPYTWEDLKPIDTALADGLRKKGIERISYTEFVTESEESTSEQLDDDSITRDGV